MLVRKGKKTYFDVTRLIECPRDMSLRLTNQLSWATMRSWHYSVIRLLSARARSQAGSVASASGPKARSDENEDVVDPNRVATKLPAPRRCKPFDAKDLPLAQLDLYPGGCKPTKGTAVELKQDARSGVRK